jgi:23S rRNA pseudouridine2457 synthase
MALILFNKPYRVLCQFSAPDDRPTLARYIDYPGVYPAGRLDYESEGLLLLTDDGRLQARISDSRHKLEKRYWVQVEGQPDKAQLEQLSNGVTLKDGLATASFIEQIETPAGLWIRVPPIRERRHIPTSWLDLEIREGRNRQVRRMTAAVGLPTLRLVRHRVGPWKLEDVQPGEWRTIDDREAWRRLSAR